MGTGRFVFIPNEDNRVVGGGVRVDRGGTEEARREKKDLENVSSNTAMTSMDDFEEGSVDDPWQQANQSASDTKTNTPRAHSYPVKGKSKRPNVFGSLRRMIARPKSEQDTASTGEHTLPSQSYVKQGLDRFNTIAGSFRGSKKTEDLEKDSSFSGLVDALRIDDTTEFESMTTKDLRNLHFNNVVAESDGAEPVMYNATSAPINIPHRRIEPDAERYAEFYRNAISPSPWDDEHESQDTRANHDGEIHSINPYGYSRTNRKVPEQWSQAVNPNLVQRMSIETEYSQPDEEAIERISKSIDGNVVNITPDNIGDVLTVLKGSSGASLPSSPRHMHRKPVTLDHQGHANNTGSFPIATPIPARLRAPPQGFSSSLPYTGEFEEKLENTQWTPQSTLEKSPPAPSHWQQTTDFHERSWRKDIPKRSNTTIEPHHRFALSKKSNTENLPHPRHPLASGVARSNTLINASQTYPRSRPNLQLIQEPIHEETFVGDRYSSVPPYSRVRSRDQGRQSPQLRNRKVFHMSNFGFDTNLPVQDHAIPAIDRSSVITTFSQFIPLRNEQLHEVAPISIPAGIPTQIPQRRPFSPKQGTYSLENNIPQVPAIPPNFARHITALPKIGRDASGRFSVDHMEEESKYALAVEYEEVSAEVPKETAEEIPRNLHENHTIGTWDAALHDDSCGVSPVSSLDGNENDGKGAWIDGDENARFPNPDIHHKERDLISQDIYPSTSRLHDPSNFSSSLQTVTPIPIPSRCPPQSPAPFTTPLPFRPRTSPPHQLEPPTRTTTIEFNPNLDIPVTLPLQIRKQKFPEPRASVLAALRKDEDREAMRRQEAIIGEEIKEDELQRADKRLRSLRDGRGGMCSGA